jgi:hypothetical protein
LASHAELYWNSVRRPSTPSGQAARDSSFGLGATWVIVQTGGAALRGSTQQLLSQMSPLLQLLDWQVALSAETVDALAVAADAVVRTGRALANVGLAGADPFAVRVQALLIAAVPVGSRCLWRGLHHALFAEVLVLAEASPATTPVRRRRMRRPRSRPPLIRRSTGQSS